MNLAEIEAARDAAVAERRSGDVKKLNEQLTIAKSLDALENERAGYIARALPDRVAEVDRQIAVWCKKAGIKPPRRDDAKAAAAKKAAEEQAARQAAEEAAKKAAEQEAELERQREQEAARQAAEQEQATRPDPDGAVAAKSARQQTRG